MTLFWIQLAIVFACIIIGAKYGGIGLGVSGGFGLCLMAFVFGMRPGSPPVTVLLIITSVMMCVSILQGAGGLDYLVALAEKLLRRNPNHITFMGPLVCYLSAVLCGTAYVAFSVYPVIAEVATGARIRPERAMTMSAQASQLGITSSPMSAATAAMLGILAAYGVTPFNLLLVSVPACVLGGIVGCLFVYKRGKELEDDPEFQRRVASGEFQDAKPASIDDREGKYTPEAKRAVVLFIIGIITVVALGANPSLRPVWTVGGKQQIMSVPIMLQTVIMAFAFLIMVTCKVPGNKLASGSVFRSGMVGMAAVFGIAWMVNTFFDAFKPLLVSSVGGTLATNPLLFGLALFLLSGMLLSQGATVTALMPLGVGLGIAPETLVALFPAVNGCLLIPAGSVIITGVALDRTGTTRIGKYVLNHSYMLPVLVTVASSLVFSFIFSRLVF